MSAEMSYQGDTVIYDYPTPVDLASGVENLRLALDELREATRFARDLGLHVHMGHGLNYHNVQEVAAIHGVEELNIGQSIISRAVLLGFDRAVKEMKSAIAEGVASRARG